MKISLDSNVNSFPVKFHEAIPNHGVIFTPTISEDGILSWTNNGGLENPDPICVVGSVSEEEMDAAIIKIKGSLTATDISYVGHFGEDIDNVGAALDIIGKSFQEGIDDVWEEINKLSDETHTHSNKEYLDKFNIDKRGNLTYDGKTLWDKKIEIYSSEEGFYVAEEYPDGSYSQTYHEYPKTYAQEVSVFQSKTQTTLMITIPGDGEFAADQTTLYSIPHGTLLPEITETDNGKAVIAQDGGYILEEIHTHENKEILNKFGETDGQPTFDGSPISGNDSTIKDITVMYAEDLDGNLTEKHLTILYHENAGKLINPEIIRIQYLPEPQRGDEGKALTVQNNGTYAWEDLSETIFIEMIQTDDEYSLVDTTYEDIDNYVNERKNVIIFWKVHAGQFRYYNYHGFRTINNIKTHIFGYHYGTAHESVFVQQDGIVKRSGVFNAVDANEYNEHIAEYNKFVESIPSKTSDLENDSGFIQWEGITFVTPQKYGAKGDGETDDTQAFQQAVDSGYDVYIPKGTYSVGNVSITNPVHIVGAGYPRLVFPIEAYHVGWAYQSLSIFVCEGGTALGDPGVDGVIIEGIHFDGNCKAIVEANYINEGLEKPEYMANVKTHSCGVYIKERSKNITVRDCKFDDFKDAGVAAVQSSKHLTVENCVIGEEGWHGYGFNKGIVASLTQFTGSSEIEEIFGYITFRNNRIFNCGEHGINIYSGYRHCIVEGNYVKDCGLMYVNPDPAIIDATLTWGYCIKTSGGSNLLIANNTCINGMSNGIGLMGDSKYGNVGDMRIIGNHIIGSDSENSKGSGIEVGHVYNAIISDNIIENIRIHSYNNVFGVRCTNGAIISNNVIRNCDKGIGVKEDVSGEVYVGTTQITGNIIVADYPIQISGMRGGVVSNNHLQGNTEVTVVTEEDVRGILMNLVENSSINNNVILNVPCGISGNQSSNNVINGNIFREVKDKPIILNTNCVGNVIDFGVEELAESIPESQEVVYVEMVVTNGVCSLVDTTYEDISNYINERQNVIIFWKINSNSVRYYTYTDKRLLNGGMTHVFGYHFDVSHESVFVKEDGTVTRGGMYTAVSSGAYDKHIEEYNAFVASFPETTEADNGKFLTVQNGVYALTTIPSAEGVGF